MRAAAREGGGGPAPSSRAAGCRRRPAQTCGKSDDLSDVPNGCRKGRRPDGGGRRRPRRAAAQAGRFAIQAHTLAAGGRPASSAARADFDGRLGRAPGRRRRPCGRRGRAPGRSARIPPRCASPHLGPLPPPVDAVENVHDRLADRVPPRDEPVVGVVVLYSNVPGMHIQRGSHRVLKASCPSSGQHPGPPSASVPGSTKAYDGGRRGYVLPQDMRRTNSAPSRARASLAYSVPSSATERPPRISPSTRRLSARISPSRLARASSASTMSGRPPPLRRPGLAPPAAGRAERPAGAQAYGSQGIRRRA